MKISKGFTLIELLVVIAIIGILSSVVLVSLNTARSKGKDARIISDVQQARTALEAGYTGTAYVDVVPNGTGAGTSNIATGNSTTVNTLVADAVSQSGGLTFRVNTGASNAVNAYAIYGQLASNASLYFCIDSTGKTNAAATTNATAACP